LKNSRLHDPPPLRTKKFRRAVWLNLKNVYKITQEILAQRSSFDL